MRTAGPGDALPRLVVAAPSSGSGKTTVATGLMAALRDRGLEVSGHKVGPDYIDPGWHAVATGRPGRSLDPVLQGPDRVVPLLLHGARAPRPADVAVIEGVMGLFDGALGRDGEGSTAHVATLTASPVVLVVDAAGAARSVAATVHGFATFDPATRVAGVLLNRVGSARHEAELRRSLEAVGVEVVGVLRRDPQLEVGSRHLGLVTAAEHADAAEAVARMGERVARDVDLDAVLRIARTAPSLGGEPWEAAHEVAPQVDPAAADTRPVVAVLAGAAFTFTYPEHRELLSAAGADVVDVDPLRDTALPAGTAALVLGGGFPEVHAAALSSNGALRAQVADAVRSGVPTAAECAGLLYLCESLDGHPMCGVIPATATMTRRLVLGYRDAVALSPSPLHEPGERLAGHEFHRTEVVPRSGHGVPRGSWASGAAWGWAVDGDTSAGPEGFAAATLHASYLHLHWAGRPSVAARLVAAARVGRSAPVGQSVPSGRIVS